MKSVVIIDTLYPEFLKTVDYPSDYDLALEHILQLSFGTSDFLSRAFREFGWTATDIIANSEQLSELWNLKHRVTLPCRESVLQQIEELDPDVVFVQDLSYFVQSELESLRKQRLVVGQCSCALTHVDKIKQFDLIFTSFPFYVELFNELGVAAKYLPLAFDPIVLSRTAMPDRDQALSFVGGFGWQWTNAEPLLELVAASIPDARFYGYGAIPQRVQPQYQGPAWGLDMYQIFRRSKIVLNRHGAIARDCSNNLRLFEATGCGALLLTEKSHNLGELFTEHEVVSYSSTADAVDKIRYYLAHPIERMLIASNGQIRTHKEHTYLQRMKIIDQELKSMLGQDSHDVVDSI